MAKETLGGKSILSSHLKDNKDSHYNFEDEKIFHISTGSLLLDSELSGSLEVPAIVRFTGVSGGGKTSAALLIMNNFLKTVPNSKAFLVKAEGRLNSNVKRVSGVEFVHDPSNTIIPFETTDSARKLIISSVNFDYWIFKQLVVRLEGKYTYSNSKIVDFSTLNNWSTIANVSYVFN